MPEENDNANMMTIIFKLDFSLVDALDERAKLNDRTRSGELRAILRAVLTQNDQPPTCAIQGFGDAT